MAAQWRTFSDSMAPGPMMRRHWRCPRIGRAGATSLEFALVAIIPVLLTFGTIEFGRVLWTHQVMMHVADMTARCYSISSALCSGTNTPASYAVALAARDGLNLTSSNVTPGAQPSCDTQTGGSMKYYAIGINYTFSSPVASLLPLPTTLSVSSQYGC
jgi:Flp pilus assembly protein TadG